MAERIFTMSQRELDCIHVIKQVMAKKIIQISAEKQLNISVRHVRRLSRTHERQGAKGLISKVSTLKSHIDHHEVLNTCFVNLICASENSLI
jgi:type I site-specific restriction endonuclease